MVVEIKRMQQRVDTSTGWAATDPVLMDGELGWDTTVKRFRVGDGLTPWSGLPLLFPDVTLPFFRPEDYGAVGDGVADDTAALQAAMDDAFSLGGGLVLLTQRYGWRGDLKHRGAITVQGVARQKVLVTPDGLDRGLIALDSTARYRYGQWSGATPSSDDNPGALRDLVIDGGLIGGANALLSMECVDGQIIGCNIVNSVGHAVQVGGSQNSTIDRCVIGHSAGSAMDFTNNPGQGAGAVKINNTYFATSRYLLTATSDPVNFWPHDVFLTGCLFENYTAGNDLVQIKAGNFQFSRCVFTNSNSASPPPPNGCLVLVQQTAWPTVATVVVFDSCYFNGGTTGIPHAVRLDSTGGVGHIARWYGHNDFQKVSYTIGFDGGSSLASIEGTVFRGTGVGWYQGLNGGTSANVYRETATPTRYVMPDDALLGNPFATRRVGDVTDRFRIDRDGVVRWMDGALATNTIGSLSTDAVNSLVALGGRMRFANTFARRAVSIDVTAPGQTVALTAQPTGAPTYLLNFTTTTATATVTMTSGMVGQEVVIGLIGQATNTVTWPVTFKFHGGVAPTALSGSIAFVTLVQHLDGLWYEMSRSGDATGGGGGDVTSVNGQTGDVYLSAADVDAEPSLGNDLGDTYLRGDKTWATMPRYGAPSQAEAEAGTATVDRVWTAVRVAQAIAAQAPLNDQVAANRVLSPAQETMPREYVDQNNVAGLSGLMELTYFTAYRSQTVNSLRSYTGGTAAAATPTLCRMGLYSVAGNGDLTLIASTPNDTTVWAAANTAYTRAVSAPVSVTKGTRYAFARLVVTAATPPSWAAMGLALALNSVAPRLQGQLSGQTDLPASVTAASVNTGSVRRFGELVT